VSYIQSTWPLLGGVMSNFVQTGDASTLTGFFAQSYQSASADNTFAVLTSSVCADAPWPTSWDKWHRDSDATHALAPNTTWGNTWANAPCFFWKVPAANPARSDGSRVSALLVHEELDAPTPFEGSLEVRSRFPNSALVSVPGGTNTAAVPIGNTCVNDAVAAYLATGALPTRKAGRQSDALCAAAPLPTP
jgi:hypothetical protein